MPDDGPRPLHSGRRSVVTTDASEVAISAVLTKSDDDGHHNPVAYKSYKLTAAEQAYPPHVLDLLAVVHALRVFRHYLLGSGAPRPPGVHSDFTLRTDNRAVSWLRINRFLARWLDEIEEFRFDVEYVPGRLNPADPLTRSVFPDRDPCTVRPAAPADPAPAPAAAAIASPGPPTAASPPPATIAAAVAAVRPAVATGQPASKTPSPRWQVHRCDWPRHRHRPSGPAGPPLFVPPFVATWSRVLPTDPFFAPIFKGAAATVAAPSTGGAFIIRCGLLYRRGQGEADRLCVPAGGG